MLILAIVPPCTEECRLVRVICVLILANPELVLLLYCSHQARSAIAPTPVSGPGGLLPTSLPDDQAAPLHEHGPAAIGDHGTDCSAVLADPDSAVHRRVRW